MFDGVSRTRVCWFIRCVIFFLAPDPIDNGLMFFLSVKKRDRCATTHMSQRGEDRSDRRTRYVDGRVAMIAMLAGRAVSE